jgi:hypothetical protein
MEWSLKRGNVDTDYTGSTVCVDELRAQGNAAKVKEPQDSQQITRGQERPGQVPLTTSEGKTLHMPSLWPPDSRTAQKYISVM